MNFRRIFLVKCLLLFFPSVKCSVSNRIYRAVNESALLSITTIAGGVYDATWLRDRNKLLQIKNKTVKYYASRNQCRCKIFPNGTLQIQNVVKEDSGNYAVTVYMENGKLKAEEEKTLIVQDPVPQPILSAECINKTASVKCEVKQKTKDEAFLIELTQDKNKKLQKNATKLELHTRYSGMFRCVVKNQVSEKTAEKLIKCSGQLDLYLILIIAGGAVFFVIFVILIIYCIRKKKRERFEDDGEEQMMQACKVDSEMVVRKLPQPPCNPAPKQLRVQQRPLPQPQVQERALPPRPRPRAQPRTLNHPRERP
ncbi:T-cell surface antigen CD2 [Indicator indicator]|uniref:T-cell surface antigen CD2 n=1 Tax=Indicator indicator TaxID=1002788 RepID=UPI0023E00A9D|nr:T-cell surface antigen CD2 [Indicator indicator]